MPDLPGNTDPTTDQFATCPFGQACAAPWRCQTQREQARGGWASISPESLRPMGYRPAHRSHSGHRVVGQKVGTMALQIAAFSRSRKSAVSSSRSTRGRGRKMCGPPVGRRAAFTSCGTTSPLGVLRDLVEFARRTTRWECRSRDRPRVHGAQRCRLIHQ
jgi:hypothetical protein